MNTAPPADDAPSSPANHPGTPTLFAVRERALELALMHGGSISDVTAFDHAQAVLELTVPFVPDPKAAL